MNRQSESSYVYWAIIRQGKTVCLYFTILMAMTLAVVSILQGTGDIDCSSVTLQQYDNNRLPLAKTPNTVVEVPQKEERLQLNTPAAEEERQRRALETKPVYRHRKLVTEQFGIGAARFLQLVLRTLTNEHSIFDATIHPEPFTIRDTRINFGCKHTLPTCIFTWDAFARAMSTADVVLDTVLTRNVPGAVVEVGVYKGGMAAYLQALLMVSGQSQQRDLWLVDSFQGMPPPNSMTSKNDNSTNKFNSAFQQDVWAGDLNCSVHSVRTTFDRLGLLDKNVRFLKGFVEDTLPGWSVQSISVLRVDVDIYAAIYDTLHYLYPRLEVGGVVLFDDFKFEYAQAAIHEYRQLHNVTTPIHFLPGSVDPMAYWIKE